MAGDSIGVTLIMANLLTNANDPIQLLPLILVGEAAARWGRPGGFWGGVLGGVLSSLWVAAVHVRSHLLLPLSFVTFRFLFFVVLGTFVGSIVQQSRTQRRSAEAVFNGSRDLVASFGLDGRLRSVNPASVDILGYAPEELIGQDRALLLAPESDLEVPDQPDASSYRRDGARLVEVQMTHKDGRPVWMEVDLLPDLTDGVIRVIGRDISARRRTEAELRRRVELDGLTGAMNRGALVERLTALLAAGSKPGLVFVDIDRFKAINDDHGHVAGDQALVELVLRLSRAAGPDDQVARYVGHPVLARWRRRAGHGVARCRDGPTGRRHPGPDRPRRPGHVPGQAQRASHRQRPSALRGARRHDHGLGGRGGRSAPTLSDGRRPCRRCSGGPR
jgi:PAS domain S-box-containing protein